MSIPGLRKLLLPALLTAFLLPIRAQITGGSPFICSVSAPNAGFVRPEGEAELIGDILITCTGGTTGSTVSANVNVLFNTQITSRILTQNVQNSEALLIIDDLAAPATPGTNIFQGLLEPDGKWMSFQNVPMTSPGNGIRTFRMTNLRVNASALPIGSSVQTLITLTSSTFIPINNNPVISAWAVPSYRFAAQTVGGASVQNLTYQQSGGSNPDLAANSAATTGVVNYALSFSETLPQSFKKRNTATSIATATAIADQPTPGTAYNTESGLYSNLFSAVNNLNVAGLATQGTRLKANFTNVPANVSLYVTVAPLPASGSAGARLISTDSSGAGDFSLAAQTTTASASGTPVGIAPVTLSQGSGNAVWEVLDGDPAALDNYSFGLVVVYTSPQAGSTVIEGRLAPIATSSSADAVSPLPRFANFNAADTTCGAPPCLSAVPNGLQFSYTAGGQSPVGRTVSITSTGTPLSFSVSADSQTGGLTWLSASAPTNGGTTPSTITISVDPSGLPTGVYTGNVQLTPSAGTAVSIPVVFSVDQGSAGTPFQCLAMNAAVTPTTRLEGLSEKMGDVVLQCWGGDAGTNIVTNVQINTSVGLANRILNAGTGATDTLLLVDEPHSSLVGAVDTFTPGVNVIQGILVDSTHILFPNVLITGLGSTASTGFVHQLRITNVRAPAHAAGVGEITPGVVNATVTASGLYVANASLPVTYVTRGLTFSTANASDNSAAPVLSFQQAGGANNSLVSSPSAAGGILNYDLQFTSNFGTAFKKRNFATSAATPNAIADDDVTGSSLNSTTESGFLDTSLPATNGLNQAGLASQGTRLMAHFTNVPPGVSLYLTTSPTSVTAPSNLSLIGPTAQLINTDASGAGAYSAVSATSSVDINGNTFGIAPVQLTNGSGTAVWEVLESNTNENQQRFHFGLLAAYVAPQTGSAFVNGTFAPLSTVTTPDANAPEPRFVDIGVANLTITSGNLQSTGAGAGFNPLTVHATDPAGIAIRGLTINFAAPASGASGTFPGGVSSYNAVTDVFGNAVALFSANASLGNFNIVARVNSLSATFSLTNTPGSPAHITISSASDNQTAAIGTAFSAALSAVVTDASGNPVPGISVTFTAPGSGAAGTFSGAVASLSANTDASGTATAPAFTANATLGNYTVSATAGELIGFIHLTNAAGTPAHLTITAGNNQSVTVATGFPTPFQVNVTDAGNNPLSNLTVNFTAPSSGAGGTFSGSNTSVTVTTDALGNAAATAFTANTKAGTFTVTANIASLSQNFSLTNDRGAAAMTITAGNNQSAAIGAPFTIPLAVTIADSFGNPYADSLVTFSAPTSGPSGAFTGSASVTTNAAGVATAPTFTANNQIGRYQVTATWIDTSKKFDLSNLAGAPASVSMVTGTPQSATVSTAFGSLLSVKVTDSLANPLAGVSVTFTAPGSGASGVFGGAAVVTTDASGIATAPALTANGVAGIYTVKAAVNSLTVSFNLTNLAGSASNMIASGTPQSAAMNQPFGPLSVKVTDTTGNPIAGVSVTYTAPATGASGTFTGNPTVTSDASGNAAAPTFTANSKVGSYAVQAQAGSLAATFNLSNVAAISSIQAFSGSGQTTVAGSNFGFPLVARVIDSLGSPVANAIVTFTLPGTGASASFAGSGLVFSTTTNPLGQAISPSLTANQIAGSYNATAATGGLQATFALSNGSPTPVTMSPDSMTFVADPGLAAPPAQTASVDGIVGPLSAASDRSWLHVSVRGSMLVVSVDQTGLAANHYFGNISVSQGPSMAVTLIVNPRPQIRSSATSLAFQYTQGGTAPAAQGFTVMASLRNFAFSVAAQQMTTTKSAWLQVTADSASTPSDVHVSVSPAGLDPGSYQGILHVTAGEADNSPFEIAVTLTVAAAPPPPVVLPSITALVNAASSQAGTAAANEIISLYGTNLTCSGTTQVLVNGSPAQALSTGATQINWLVPAVIDSQISVQVACGGLRSNTVTMQVSPSSPALFTGSGNQVAAYNTGYTLNCAGAPADRGSVLMLFGTGFGAVGAPDGSGLQRLVIPVSVKVGGIAAEVLFAGAAPGLPGVTQINIQIPAGTVTGPSVPVQVLSLITPSQTTLTIAVN